MKVLSLFTYEEFTGNQQPALNHFCFKRVFSVAQSKKAEHPSTCSPFHCSVSSQDYSSLFCIILWKQKGVETLNVISAELQSCRGCGRHNN